MLVVDLLKIRETLPKHGTATLYKREVEGKTVCYIQCWIKNPSLSEMYPKSYEEDFEMIKQWQREILGAALGEFYTEQTGLEWKIYLKMIPIQFINATNEDIENYSGFSVKRLKQLLKKGNNVKSI